MVLALALLLLASTALPAFGATSKTSESCLKRQLAVPGKFNTLVPMGDSYTDTGARADGGTVWPVYAAGYAKAELHSFAVSGAVCSSALVPSGFKPVIEGQIPALKAANLTLDPATTLYTLWIGTNDVDEQGLLAAKQVKGVTIVDVARCGDSWVKALYAAGARSFVSMNMVPLDFTPRYATSDWDIELLRELVAAGNALRDMSLQLLAPNLPGAHIAFFDTHGLFTDIINTPAKYLNGTAPLNTNNTVGHCKTAGGCTNETDKDSFLWYDSVHPSEQADRLVAREIATVMRGEASQWIKWIS